MTGRALQTVRPLVRQAAISSARTHVCAPRYASTSTSSSSSSSQKPSEPTSGPPPSSLPPRKQSKRGGAGQFLQVDTEASRHRTQYNEDPFTLEPTEEHYNLPLVTAAELADSSTRPKSARMLSRDFIHDSLYNPAYGYFSRHAVLLPDGARGDMVDGSWDFGMFKNDREFAAAVQSRYDDFESSIIPKEEEQQQQQQKSGVKPAAYHSKEGLEQAQAEGKAAYLKSMQQGQEHDSDVQSMVARQVWHTPTELFKPHYANIIAQHCLDSRPNDTDPVCIYELGAGSGSLAEAILNYYEERYPEIYETAQYNIIEISERLSQQQRTRLARHEAAGKLRVHNKDFFEWNTRVEENCSVIGLEVLDNLTHDVIRYSTADWTPYQAYVSIDSTGDMHELYAPVTDPLIKRYLDMYTSITGNKTPPTGPNYLSYLSPNLRKGFTEKFPLYPNLTQRHYIPTGSLKFLDVLHKNFPNHNLVVSDFHSLPNTLEGINAPVVQTRFQNTMIPVTKYTVLQGFFDIFFPTDFNLFSKFYTNTAQEEKGGRVYSHRGFLEKYQDLTKECNLKDGSNPMLNWYANASWFIS